MMTSISTKTVLTVAALAGFSMCAFAQGAAPCANAHVENPARTATVKTVFVEMLVIIHPPRGHSASCPTF